MERSSPTWVSGTGKGEQNSQMGKELSLTGKLPGRDIYIYILLGCLMLHWDHSDHTLDPKQSSGHAEAPEVVQTQSVNTTHSDVIPFASFSGCWCTNSTKDHISAHLMWNPLHQPMNAEGQVQAGLWSPGPRDRYTPGSCWHGAGGTTHSRGPFWTGTFFPPRITQMKNCICVKESIPWPSSPRFSLKCCLSPLSTTLPTKEWYFSLELLSALIGCECLKHYGAVIMLFVFGS